MIPSSTRHQPVTTCEDNAVVLLMCDAQVDTAGTITMLKFNGTGFVTAGWTASGTRQMGDFTITYQQ